MTVTTAGVAMPGPRREARPEAIGGHGASAPWPTLRSSAVLAALALLAAAPASAQGKLDARYEVTLAGIPVGKGVLGGRYRRRPVFGLGLRRHLGAAEGLCLRLRHRRIAGPHRQWRAVPQAYSATVHSKKSETIRMSLAAGNIKEFAIDPEPPVDPDRIPVTDAHRRGVLDPMTGSLLRVPGTADPVGPEACRAGRRDLRRPHALRAEARLQAHGDMSGPRRAIHGPVVVCAVYFTPIAGYIPDRAAIKYLAAQRNIEAWFAPIAGTRVLVPFRMMIPTPLGMGVLEATQFVTQATPPRVAKTQ